MRIILANTRLPTTFVKTAELEFALGLGVWITIAKFVSKTRGVRPAFFLYAHRSGYQLKEISHNVFSNLVLRSLQIHRQYATIFNEQGRRNNGITKGRKI